MTREEASEPLLSVSVDVPINSSPDQESSQPDAPRSLQKSLYRNPREAIKWLESEGVKKLGTFQVQVSSSDLTGKKIPMIKRPDQSQ